MSLTSLRRHFSAVIALASWLCLGLTGAVTLAEAWRHHYLEYGFHRTLILSLHEHLIEFWLPLLLATLLLAILTAWRDHRQGNGLSWANHLVALALGSCLYVLIAEAYHRVHFATAWVRRREWLGLELPRALWRSDFWLANLVILLLAAVLALAIWIGMRRLLVQHPQRAARWWRFLQRPVVLIIALALVIFPPLGSRLIQRAARSLPSIILISIDTLRADHLHCYHYYHKTSPFIDIIASQGIQFEWAFTPAPTTPPAHMSIFTSLYPTVHGFTGYGDKLPDRQLTVTEYFRERGYRTYATTDGGYLRGRVGFGQGFEEYDDRHKGIAESVPLALQWLDEEIGPDSYFLFIHCYDVHSPYDPPQPYRDLFTDPNYDGDFEPTAEALEAIRVRMNQNPAAGTGLTAADVEYMIARYDGGIRYTDEWIGELFRGLRERGRLETTWLFITSDHGEEFTEHGSVLHEKLYHTVTRIPLIVRPADQSGLAQATPAPGELPNVKVVARIAELIDLMPTFLDLIGQRAASLVQGESLLPFMRGQNPPWLNQAFSELPWFGQRRSITTLDHQLITSLDYGEVELYRYRADPRQQKPVEANALPGERETLLHTLLEWNGKQQELARQRGRELPRAPLDPAAEEQLRALGYIQ